MWVPGQVLTASELTSVTNMLPYPSSVSTSVNPCVAGTLYLCTSSAATTMTLPSPATGSVVGFMVHTATPPLLGVTVTASSGTIYSQTGNGLARGVASVVLSQPDQYLVLMADGANWHEYGSSPTPAQDAVSAYIVTSETTTSTSWADLSTAGPEVDVYTGTQALVSLFARIGTSTGGGAHADMGFVVGGVSSIAPGTNGMQLDVSSNAAATGITVSAHAEWLVTGLTPGLNTFKARYIVVGSVTGTYDNRRIVVKP